jgi:hypothetical protein
MVNRKEEQGEEAIKKIKEECGQDAKIEWEGCDMGTLKEVKEVFTKIREREERLDLVSLHTMSDLAVWLTGDVAHSFRRH